MVQEVVGDILTLMFGDCGDPRIPRTYKQLVSVMERQHGLVYYKYDACPGPRDGKPCHFLYRCEYRHHEVCPLCNTTRKNAQGKPRLQMVYQPLSSYLQFLYGDADLARWRPINLFPLRSNDMMFASFVYKHEVQYLGRMSTCTSLCNVYMYCCLHHHLYKW